MNKQIIFAASAVFVLLVGFQNCGLTSSSHTDLSSSLGKTCAAAAQKAFADTYYPHVRSQCSQCHDNGGMGISWFASADPSFAFTAFMNTGREKLNSMMVYDGHPGPNNGPNQQGFVNSMAAQWGPLDKQIDDCINANAYTTVGKNVSVADVAINDANDSNKRPWKTLEFDLFTDSAAAVNNGKIEMVVRLQYRESGAGTVNGANRDYLADIGYEFRMPQAKIRAGAPADAQYAVDKMTVLMNGRRISSVTSFEAISNAVVAGPAFADIIASAGSAGIVNPKNPATDVFAIRFAEIRNANGQAIGGGTTGGGSSGPTVPARVTYVELTTASNQYGYFASRCVSCHNANNAAGGLNMANYQASANSAASIRSRVNNQMRPMPPAGLLPQFERDVITKWADIGAPQN